MEATINAFDMLTNETASVRVVWHRTDSGTTEYSHEVFDSMAEAEPFANMLALDETAMNPYVVAGGRVMPLRPLRWHEKA